MTAYKRPNSTPTRSHPMKRSPMRRRSSKQAKADRQLRVSKLQRLAATDGYCEVRAPGCTGIATDAHHIHGRGGGRTDTVDAIRVCCRACHSFLHANRDWAKAHGFIVRRAA